MISDIIPTDCLQRVHMVPNPCEFAINGINFAASSVDILFHLRKEEFFKSAATANTNANASVVLDPMANTCRHLLQQRRFVLSNATKDYS